MEESEKQAEKERRWRKQDRRSHFRWFIVGAMVGVVGTVASLIAIEDPYRRPIERHPKTAEQLRDHIFARFAKEGWRRSVNANRFGAFGPESTLEGDVQVSNFRPFDMSRGEWDEMDRALEESLLPVECIHQGSLGLSRPTYQFIAGQIILDVRIPDPESKTLEYALSGDDWVYVGGDASKLRRYVEPRIAEMSKRMFGTVTPQSE